MADPLQKRFGIKAYRWPWHKRTGNDLFRDPFTESAGMKYGWRPTGGVGRFGGGTNWALGFESGGWCRDGITIVLNLLFGKVLIFYRTKKAIEDAKYLDDLRRRVVGDLRRRNGGGVCTAAPDDKISGRNAGPIITDDFNDLPF